jgi:hypothetical protein
MRKSLIGLCLLCLCVGVRAQELQKQGRGVDDLVPEGWVHTEATGDLNKDGKEAYCKMQAKVRAFWSDSRSS